MSTPKRSDLGSIFQRQSDGRWVASLRLGSGRRVTRYATSRKTAQQLLQTLLTEHSAGILAPPTQMTLETWVDRWLDLGESTLRPTTLATYRAALAPILLELGHQRLDKLTPLALAGVFVALQRQGKGSRALQQSYTCLRGCLTRAVALGLLGQNPLSHVPRPRHTPQDRRYWTAPEAQQFLAVALDSPHRYAPLFVFLLGAGCRLGEALALTWADLDWEQGTARFSKALSVVAGQSVVQPPKTAAGSRIVTLPPFVFAALRQMPRPAEGGRVFLTATMTPPTKRNLLRAFRVLCGAADVPVMPVHGLRHCHAALVLAAEGDVQGLRRRLGHARASHTLDLYAYALTPDQQGARAIQRVLAPDPPAEAAEQ